MKWAGEKVEEQEEAQRKREESRAASAAVAFNKQAAKAKVKADRIAPKQSETQSSLAVPKLPGRLESQATATTAQVSDASA